MMSQRCSATLPSECSTAATAVIWDRVPTKVRSSRTGTVNHLTSCAANDFAGQLLLRFRATRSRACPGPAGRWAPRQHRHRSWQSGCTGYRSRGQMRGQQRGRHARRRPYTHLAGTIEIAVGAWRMQLAVAVAAAAVLRPLVAAAVALAAAEATAVAAALYCKGSRM